MKRSFREHQALQIARYIRSYYRGTFYIEVLFGITIKLSDSLFLCISSSI